MLIVILLSGFFLFLFQYRKRKLMFEKEKAMTEKQHHLDLLNTQIDSQQQTMQYIGREIHDNVGQKLTLASLYCRQSSNIQHSATINQLIDDSLQELRRLSKSLTDTGQPTNTLVQLLRNEAALVNRSGICHMQVTVCDHFPLLTITAKQMLLRILQEFIQNSLKHANCNEIKVDLFSAGGQAVILASDNGKGFDTLAASSGIGLQSMRRRADELQAKLQFSSLPGQGTVLSIQLHSSSIIINE